MLGTDFVSVLFRSVPTQTDIARGAAIDDGHHFW